MHCPKCHTENRAGARFCRQCAARLLVICTQCGTELIPDAQFCDACGMPVGAPPPEVQGKPAPAGLAEALQRLVPKEYTERLLAAGGPVPGERRLVTILFCDVKGSTALAEHLDPEDVLEIMNSAFQVLIPPITRYEGTLARLMGDGILAFFGAPIAHEDDPERACRAGLDILAGVREYAARLERERGIPGFDVRVGIHTGLVVVGEVGTDLRVEYTVLGDAVNLAARMESAAEPGTVLITEDTHQLVAPLFETQALGPIAVKGKPAPVPGYRVLAAKVTLDKPRGLPGLTSPLVGRQTEFETLEEALAQLQAGVGGIVTLVGEAGIGKSRLVAEIRKGAVTASLQWVEGRCLSYGGSIAYLLWLDLLRGLLGVTLDTPPATVHDTLQTRVQALCPEHLADVTPYLARLMALPLDDQTQAQLDDLDGRDLKARTFRAVETLVAGAAREQPLVLVGEDLHWADPSSLELLEHVLALTDRTALLIVCVFRPLKKHGSWLIKEAAARTYGHRHTALELPPLSPAESATLVSHLLRVEDLSPELKERILSTTEGNPFYVEEILRALIDTGAIAHDEATGRWIAPRAETDIAIPDTLQGVLLARMDRLQEETRRVLQLAAVIGRIFLYRVLAALAEEERRLDAHLVTLQREEMIRERARIPELEYIFKHELTREAAYNGLLKKDRRVYHRQVAEALEQLFPERVDEQVGLLAYHWERAKDAAKATEYLLRAGDQARLAYAHAEAIGYYQRALEFLREAGDLERAARTLMKLGLTHHTTFEFQASRQAYEEGFALWQQAGKRDAPTTLPPAPHALRTLVSEPATLDPGLATDFQSFSVIEQLFSGLAESTPEMSVVPDVARGWEVLDGGSKYVFTLRDDVRWSDGTPVTSRDFEYAWKRALDPVSGSSAASLLYDIQGASAYHQGKVADPDRVGVHALDEFTLVVELEGPTGYFPHLLTHVITFPVPRHVVQAQGAAWTEPDHIVTNGPFRLAFWERGESLVLERNPTYHGRFTGNLQRVELSFLAGPPARILQMYEEDHLETFELVLLSQAERERARQRYAGEYIVGPRLGFYGVRFNVNRSPFDDRRVRRAFTLATDREAQVDVTLKVEWSPATGGLVPPGMPGHSPGIGLPYDPERARHLLAEAGYPDGRGFPVLEVLTSSGLSAVSTVEYLQAQWRENLGIEITWQRMEWGRYLERLREGPVPHVWPMGWSADYPDPDSFLRGSIWKESYGWQPLAYDELVEGARRAIDQEQRMRMYQQADRILVEEAPILPLVYGRVHLLVKPWVTKFPTSPMKQSFWKDAVIEPH